MTDSETSVLWDPAMDPLFRRAERLGTESAWWGHVPFANWLVRACQPKLIVELGTHSGVSYSAFCEAALREHLEVRCYAVDTWQGDEHAGRYDEQVYLDFKAFHDERYAAFSNLLRTTFDDAVTQFEDSSIDLLHLDGLHTYEAVKHDFEVWESKCSERSVLLLHDANERHGDFGVWRFYRELAGRFPAFEFLHDHGLGVIAVGRGAPDAVLELCALKDEKAVSRVRERFAFLGDRWRSDMGEKRTWKLTVARESDAQLRSGVEAKLRADLIAGHEGQLRAKQEEAEILRRECLGSRNEAAGLKRQLEALRLQHAEALNKAAAANDAHARNKSQPAAEGESEGRLHTKIAALETGAEAASRSLSEMRSKLQAETSCRSRAESSSKTAAAELSSLRRELQETNDQLNRSKEEHAALLQSRSWRLTAPLRKMAEKTAPRAVGAPSAEPAVEANAGVLRQSPLFSSDWYLKRYPDVAEARVDPALHYLTCGASEGRDPGPEFDTSWYLERHADVSQTGINPLLHYLQFGLTEGREIRASEKNQERSSESPDISAGIELIKRSNLFDPAWYRKQYPDIAEADLDPAEHYLVSGAAEGRNPGPIFSTRAYVERHPELRDSGENALVHYLQHKNQEDSEFLRQARLVSESDLFDAEWYKQRNPDVVAAGVDPIWHYLLQGAAEGRNPGSSFDGAWYLQVYPDVAKASLNPLVHYLEYGAPEGRQTRPVGLGENGGVPVLRNLLQARANKLVLNAYTAPPAPRRLTLVTDSINRGSLYGGVATSLLLSACLAKRLDATLRLVTRGQAPENMDVIDSLLSVNGISWSGNLEVLHSPHPGNRQVPISDNDLFLTTSWWTTRSVLATVSPSRIIYLLQEDERMFYPHGDERLSCEETLFSPGIHFVINSELLFDHLTSGPDALPGVKRGVWFEPAFPYLNYHAELRNHKQDKKRNLFFYARPLNLRNLYWRGLEGLSSAIEAGVFDTEDWDFYFVGKSLEKFILPNGREPILLENLQWEEYGELVRKMDVGLCLMDTPHPSYPPLDLAASGAIVVTNRRGVKTSLSRYSENILCVESSKASIAQGLQAAVDLVCNDGDRLANYSKSALLRDWNIAFEPVLQHLTNLLQTQGY